MSESAVTVAPGTSDVVLIAAIMLTSNTGVAFSRDLLLGEALKWAEGLPITREELEAAIDQASFLKRRRVGGWYVLK